MWKQAKWNWKKIIKTLKRDDKSYTVIARLLNVLTNFLLIQIILKNFYIKLCLWIFYISGSQPFLGGDTLQYNIKISAMKITSF